MLKCFRLGRVLFLPGRDPMLNGAIATIAPYASRCPDTDPTHPYCLTNVARCTVAALLKSSMVYVPGVNPAVLTG